MASVLVIDDEAQVRAFVRLVAEAEGHEVREAGDGLKGVKAHRLRPADLILCDLFMPGKEGLETIRELTREFPGVRIIAISGGNPRIPGGDLLGVAKALGAVNALPKPLDRGTLTATVRAVLGG